jgi:hypothetical protein
MLRFAYFDSRLARTARRCIFNNFLGGPTVSRSGAWVSISRLSPLLSHQPDEGVLFVEPPLGLPQII